MGRVVLNHDGNRREAGALFEVAAIGSGFPASVNPPYAEAVGAPQKGVRNPLVAASVGNGFNTRLHQCRRVVVCMVKRVVLITGAGQRLGAGMAARLMDEGCFVLVHVRSSLDAAQRLLEEAHQRNGKPCGDVVQADLTVEADVAALVEAVNQHEQVVANGLYGLVHNASFYSQSSFEETPLSAFRQLNRLHMEAPYALTQKLLPQLEQGGGSVVAIVDTSWGRAWEGLAHYTSSKAGLRQLMLNLAGELVGRVRVNCLAPGAIMAADWEAEHFAKVLEKVPLGRSGSAEDIAAGVCFLLGHNTLSGHVLHVDGGWSTDES